MMRTWEFEEAKGEIDSKGKTQWNDHITIYLSHRHAFDLIQVLLHQYQLAQTDPAGSDVVVQLLGELAETEEREAVCQR